MARPARLNPTDTIVKVWPLPLVMCAFACGGALVWARVSGAPALVGSMSLQPQPVVAVPRAPYDPTLVHQMLEFYARRTERDPGDAWSGAMLARWYLESYRETGDSADARRAELAARASLKTRELGNSAAYFQLSRSLLTQHRFREALEAARRASRYDLSAYRECADIEIEIGTYAGAEKDLARAPHENDDPAYWALVSRLKEIHGDSAGALALLTRAAAQADANPDMPRQSLAWFHERLGRLQCMTGRRDQAEQSYLSALDAFPRDYRSMAALAHLYANRRDWERAIEWGTKAANLVPAPETLALLGDCYRAQGKTSQARAQYRLVEQIGDLAVSQGALYDRQRALYYADHGLKPELAVQLARGEMGIRPDIYSYDTLGWTLFKAGHPREAASCITKALALGTRDATIFFHGGMIAAANGDAGLAREDLSTALEIDPNFHPDQPEEARTCLAQLGAAQKVG